MLWEMASSPFFFGASATPPTASLPFSRTRNLARTSSKWHKFLWQAERSPQIPVGCEQTRDAMICPGPVRYSKPARTAVETRCASSSVLVSKRLTIGNLVSLQGPSNIRCVAAPPEALAGRCRGQPPGRLGRDSCGDVLWRCSWTLLPPGRLARGVRLVPPTPDTARTHRLLRARVHQHPLRGQQPPARARPRSEEGRLDLLARRPGHHASGLFRDRALAPLPPPLLHPGREPAPGGREYHVWSSGQP